MRRRKLWTDERNRRACDIYATGVSMHVVAARLGTSVRHVHRVLNEEGVVRQKKHMYKGDGNPAWTGGRRVVGGYVYIHQPEHPNATKQGYVLEHRLVMERKLGRLLTRLEVVHHRNGDTQDNREENLEVFASNAEHLRSELTGRKRK